MTGDELTLLVVKSLQTVRLRLGCDDVLTLDVGSIQDLDRRGHLDEDRNETCDDSDVGARTPMDEFNLNLVRHENGHITNTFFQIKLRFAYEYVSMLSSVHQYAVLFRDPISCDPSCFQSLNVDSCKNSGMHFVCKSPVEYAMEVVMQSKSKSFKVLKANFTRI